jgi:hypothetical protein
MFCCLLKDTNSGYIHLFRLNTAPEFSLLVNKENEGLYMHNTGIT